MSNLGIFEILVIFCLMVLPCLVLFIVAGILAVVVMLTRKTIKPDQTTDP